MTAAAAASAAEPASLDELRSVLRWHAERPPGWALPLDPTETGASVGGMVATNAAGSRAFRFGSARDWVDGLTVELASGRRCRCDAASIAQTAMRSLSSIAASSAVHLPAIAKPRTKNSIGYGFTPGGDAVDLFVGSEGTLGVVSDVITTTPASRAQSIPPAT